MLKNIVCLAHMVMAADIPLSGKFFYTELYTSKVEGMQYIGAQIGENQTSQNWFLSTDEMFLGIATDYCQTDGCNTPNPYAMKGIDPKRNTEPEILISEELDMFLTLTDTDGKISGSVFD